MKYCIYYYALKFPRQSHPIVINRQDSATMPLKGMLLWCHRETLQIQKHLLASGEQAVKPDMSLIFF